MDAGEVEDSELLLFRGVRAHVFFGVTKLQGEAERTEKHFVEELPIPSLRIVSMLLKFCRSGRTSTQ